MKEERMVRIPVQGVVLAADLTVPQGAVGVVLFAHGTGSGRKSVRNRKVAADFAGRGIATLLPDLFGEGEAFEEEKAFDMTLLGSRVAEGVRWLKGNPETAGLPVGLYGASTGAAAAILAAANLEPGTLRAIVSRGGRPDLAAGCLADLSVPILFLVGSLDEGVLELNRKAFAEVRCEKRLERIEGAGHLFEEPGTLEAVSVLSGDWYLEHFPTKGDERVRTLAGELKEQPESALTFLERIRENKGTEKYALEKALRLVSEENPNLLLPYLEDIADLTGHPNHFIAWGAIRTLGSLMAAGGIDKCRECLPRFTELLKDEEMITAANAVAACPGLVQAHPELEPEISELLLGLEGRSYRLKGQASPECGRVMLGHLLEAFEGYFDWISEPGKVLEFAERCLGCSRKAVVRKAAAFLKSHRPSVQL